MKKLLVIVDMQRDFVSGSLGTEEALAILPAVRALIFAAREAGEEVVFTQDTHGEDYLSTQEGQRLPVPHCIKGREGHKIMPELAVQGARIFEKNTFGSVALAQYAAAGNYDEICLAGLCTDICVVSNALLVKAFCPNARVKVVAEGCAGTTPAAHKAALDTMRSCQVDIV